MITIGLDLSYNSTGVCIIKPEKQPIFYQICPEKRKHSMSIKFKTYERHYTNADSFSETSLDKIRDAEALGKCIKDIIRFHVPEIEECEIRIEAPLNPTFIKASAALRNAQDMTVLNQIITMFMMHMKNSKVKVIMPTKIKKAFTGKGRGHKELMIETFLTKHFIDFDNTGKIDDIVDAYALAYCSFIE